MAAVDPKAPEEQRASFQDWWSGRHPAVDLSGHTLAVLEHVRHHDPLGPLADDAALQIADYHFAAGNYEDASFYYDQLIEGHPKSELLHRAHMQSIDAKLNAYLGPDYDGTGLEEARKLALQTMSLFPEQQASYSDELYHKLALIEDQMAERTYRRGERYLWTGKIAAAEYCFGEVPARWPKSPWAEQAKEQLATIATMPRKETQASRMMTLPGSTDPMTGGPTAGMGGIGGSGISAPNGFGGMGP
jgi:outer membrane protein assembly factor BamD (BamD/ComL family)